MKSITLSAAGINDINDEIVLQRLQEYCYKMKIEMQGINIDNRIFLKFSGSDYQLSELEEYLTEKTKE